MDKINLLPCPFCGGEVYLEEAARTHDEWFGPRRMWGVVCRNTINLGGTCAIQQVPSATKEAAILRWNMRNGHAPEGGDDETIKPAYSGSR